MSMSYIKSLQVLFVQCLTTFSFIILSCDTVTYAADEAPLRDAELYGPRQSLPSLLSLPLRDFICSPQYLKRRKIFIQALIKRPEFNDINWEDEDYRTIAKQLWKLQLDNSDNSYHKGLYAACKALMKYHRVLPDKAEKVQGVISELTRQRGSKNFYKTERNLHLSQEEKEAKRLKKNTMNRQRLEENKQGRSLPLLHYICVDDPKSLGPKRLHEMALRYRHMYRSPLSFIKYLRNMWKDLGYEDIDVYQQNNDARNYCPITNEAEASTSAKQADATWEDALAKVKGPSFDNTHDTFHTGVSRTHSHSDKLEEAQADPASETDSLFDELDLEDLSMTFRYPASLLSETEGQYLQHLEPLELGKSAYDPDDILETSLTFEEDHDPFAESCKESHLVNDDFDFKGWDHLL